MFTWLKRLFSPAPATPQVDSGSIYRVRGTMSPGTKPSTPSRATTLFPPPKAIDVVKPTTEADHYKWLDYGKVDTTLPPTAKTTPPPDVHRSGEPHTYPDHRAISSGTPVFGMSGTYITSCVTGMVLCVSGRLRQWFD